MVLSAVLGAVIIFFFVFEVFGLRITSEDEGVVQGPNFPPGGPAEFLYLDSDRVAAYLAQVNGGTFDAEKVIRKLSNSVGGEIGAGGAKASASKAEETSVEREVKPTDASSFFALRAGLLTQTELHELGLRYFPKFFTGLEENRLNQGDFVTFKTTALLSPQYLNAYLAVREENTVEALFPKAVNRRREAKDFAALVGEEPRVVFALQPSNDESAGPSAPTYLLPMNAGRLTAERSLIKYGGGRFTVVGKIVRVFPESSRHDPAYIDSATRETWELPLREAPLELLCRSDPNCIDEVRDGDLDGADRRKATEGALESALEALQKQTQIDNRGAVILPIAIYK